MPATTSFGPARIVVVGSGLSGSRVAVQLATGSPSVDVEVILLEAGPFSRRCHEGRDRHEHPGDARRRSWPDTGSDQWGPLSGAKARVGGRSLCWHGQLVALEDYARADWPEAWRKRLPRLSVDVTAELAPPPETAAVPAEWREAGLGPVAQAASLDADASGTVDDWSAYTPLDLAQRLPNLSIICGVAVSGVAQSGSGVRIAFVDGTSVSADICVLSAGAIGNLTVLAQSLGAVLEVPLCDHLCAGAVIGFRGASPRPPRQRGEATLLGYVSDPELRANLFFQELAPSGEIRALDLWVLAEQLPGCASRLTATPTRQGPACVAIEPRRGAGDLERLRLAVERAMRRGEEVLGAAQGVTQMRAEITAINHAWQRPGTWALYDRPMGSVDHETCSHAIGKVCEEDLSLSEIPGVFLNGPGVFPRAGAANPGLTLLALSDWLAESIKQRFV